MYVSAFSYPHNCSDTCKIIFPRSEKYARCRFSAINQTDMERARAHVKLIKIAKQQFARKCITQYIYCGVSRTLRVDFANTVLSLNLEKKTKYISRVRLYRLKSKSARGNALILSSRTSLAIVIISF